MTEIIRGSYRIKERVRGRRRGGRGESGEGEGGWRWGVKNKMGKMRKSTRGHTLKLTLPMQITATCLKINIFSIHKVFEYFQYYSLFSFPGSCCGTGNLQ